MALITANDYGVFPLSLISTACRVYVAWCGAVPKDLPSTSNIFQGRTTFSSRKSVLLIEDNSAFLGSVVECFMEYHPDPPDLIGGRGDVIGLGKCRQIRSDSKDQVHS